MNLPKHKFVRFLTWPCAGVAMLAPSSRQKMAIVAEIAGIKAQAPTFPTGVSVVSHSLEKRS